MNRKLVFRAGTALSVACLATLALAHQREETGGQDEKPEGLVRVAPVPVQEEEEADSPFDRIFRRTFSREQWAGWLASPDLDAREEYYADLLRRARIDPVARAFLEELSQDEARPHLAWTARLALRELGRADFPFDGLAGRFGLDRTLEDVLAELWDEHGGGFQHFARPRNRVRISPHLTLPSHSGSSKSFRIEQGPDGAKLVITEIVDGEESTREYVGESLEEIVRENPELSEDVEGGLRFHLMLPGEGGLGLLGPFRYGDLERGFGRIPGRGDLDRFFAPTGPSRPVRTDRLGVYVAPVGPALRNELGLAEGTGLRVRSIERGTIAHLLGVRAGDVLVELDGRSLGRPQDITDAMEARARDAELTLVWFDDLGQRHAEAWVPER